MTGSFLTWLNHHPAAYWWIGFGVTAALLFGCWLAGRRGRHAAKGWGSADGVAVMTLFLLVLAWRWPVLLDAQPGSVAESRMVASAMAMAVDAVPYQSADPGADGLLSVLVLLPTHWLGLPQVYFNARLVALLLDWGTLLAGYFVLRRGRPVGDAMLALLPAALVLGTFGVHSRLGYASWHLGLFLLALGGLLLWRLRFTGPAGWRRLARLLVAALILGFIPWCHRAALPAALGLWVVFLLYARRSAGPDGALFTRRLYQVGAMALYGNVAMVCLIHGVDQWYRFWISYVCAGTAGGEAGMEFTGATLWQAGLALAALGLGVSCVRSLDPRRAFVGAVLLTGLVLAEHFRSGMPGNLGRPENNARSPDLELAAHIRAMRLPNDRLVVWGNNPHLYVETNIRPGVSSLSSLGEIRESNAERDKFRARYLAELRNDRPRFFVDVGTPTLAGYEVRTKSGHEVFPQLAEFINDYYRLESDDGQRRLYNRHDRTLIDRKPGDMIPIGLEKVRIIQATGSLSDMGEGRWLAHAPSRFAYVLPPDAESVNGAYGFIASSYQNPSAATDGATFLIETVTGDGRREVLLKRRLNPASNPEDRGPVAFKLELPRSQGGQLEFTVDPGEGNGYDWTYWQGLECRLRASVNELSK
jgi:hypothetical protein